MFFCFGVTSTSLQFILLFQLDFFLFSYVLRVMGRNCTLIISRLGLIMLMRVIWYSTSSL